jgi:hypothetical protein
VKRPRPSDSTPVATHPFKMVKLSRSSNSSPVQSPVFQDTVPKCPPLISAYDPLALPPRLSTKCRPAPLLQVELPTSSSFAFVGMSPISSFLSSSPHINSNVLHRAHPGGKENINQHRIRNERPNYKTFQGVKYGVYPRNDVSYSILYDNVTPEK